MEELEDSDDNKTKAKAENLLARVRSFQFILMVMFMKNVMIKTKILTKQVQSVNINIVDTLESAKPTSTLHYLRDDKQNVNNLITAAVKLFERHGVDANDEYRRHHRHGRPTRRVDERPETAKNLIRKDLYRKEFIQVLDVQTKVLTGNVEMACDILAPAINILLPPFDNDPKEEDVDSRKDASTFTTTRQRCFMCRTDKQMLYRLILTAPITSASSEKTFCKLKLIKIVMRTVLNQDRLKNFMALGLHEQSIYAIIVMCTDLQSHRPRNYCNN